MHRRQSLARRATESSPLLLLSPPLSPSSGPPLGQISLALLASFLPSFLLTHIRPRLSRVREQQKQINTPLLSSPPLPADTYFAFSPSSFFPRPRLLFFFFSSIFHQWTLSPLFLFSSCSSLFFPLPLLPILDPRDYRYYYFFYNEIRPHRISYDRIRWFFF